MDTGVGIGVDGDDRVDGDASEESQVMAFEHATSNSQVRERGILYLVSELCSLAWVTSTKVQRKSGQALPVSIEGHVFIHEERIRTTPNSLCMHACVVHDERQARNKVGGSAEAVT